MSRALGLLLLVALYAATAFLVWLEWPLVVAYLRAEPFAVAGIVIACLVLFLLISVGDALARKRP